MEGNASILVTHDPGEALWLGDRIVVLSDRPAKVVDVFAVDLPRKGREAGMPEIAGLERRLNAALLGS
jgi:NitT/TauT family transport system ATP-binding protein